MGRFIIHHKGAYNIFSTVVDAPLLSGALTLDELRDYILTEYGRQGMAELSARLDRAHKTGCSGHGETLETCLSCNRAGADESEMTFDEFVRRFLTLPEKDAK